MRYNKCSGGERRKSSLKVGRYPCRVAQPEIINLVGEPLRVAVAPFPVGRAKSLAPGFRRVATAIRRHTPSSKGARQVRSTYARAASPPRNATSAVCRFAAINKTPDSLKVVFAPGWTGGRAGARWCPDPPFLETCMSLKKTPGRGGPRPVAETGRRAAAGFGGAPRY